MATRKSTSNTTASKNKTETKSSPKKKPVRRRSSVKKVKIDTSKAGLLCGIIFLSCCICIALSVLGNSTKKTVNKSQPPKTQVQTPSVVKQEPSVPSIKTQPAAPVSIQKNVPAEKKDDSSKNSSSVKKQTAVKTPAKSTELKKPENPVIIASAKGDKKPAQEKNPFNIPAAKNGAALVIVIDDAGLNVEYTKRYAELPFPLTIAVLPKLSHSKDCAYVVRKNNKELILHQPMQSFNHNLDPGPGKITVDMSFAQIAQIVSENLAEIGPGVKGLNNHEGSEVTADVLRIGAVLDTCQQNNIYFLDSRTTAETQAPQAALERDMHIFEKAGPYIDNVVSREAMLKELYKALDFANKNGKAIIIGHVDKSANILPQLLKEMYPHLKKAGYNFATPSTLK